jgi:hypothetical protein
MIVVETMEILRGGRGQSREMVLYLLTVEQSVFVFEVVTDLGKAAEISVCSDSLVG